MSVGDINWAEIEAKLPYQRDDEALARRKELFDQFDVNHNGYLSLAEADKGLRDVLQLEDVFDAKPAIKRAFHAALKYVHGDNPGPEFIKKKEFRVFLEFVQRYFELWVMFKTVDASMDRHINMDEFRAALPDLDSWGVRISEEEAETVFKNIDTNSGGQIDFSEFCTWAIEQKLKKTEEITREVTAAVSPASAVKEADIRCDFEKYDLAGEGTISKEELVAVFAELNPHMGSEQVEQILAMANQGDSDTVDYNKFLAWLFDGNSAATAAAATA